MKRISRLRAAALFSSASALCSSPAAADAIGVYRSADTTSNATCAGQFILAIGTSPADHAETTLPLPYGAAGDNPVVGDWTRQGTKTIGVYRWAHTTFNQTSAGLWLLRNDVSPGPADIQFYFGAPGDLPVVGDWDGDGVTTVGVFRPANTPYNSATSGMWILTNSPTGATVDYQFWYGGPDDLPIAGDWDGNGTTTVGVFRPVGAAFNSTTSAMWILTNDALGRNALPPFYYGGSQDQPVVGDWDGNRTTTVGVYRSPHTQFNDQSSSQWLLSNSPTGATVDYNFFYGTTGDIPLVGDHWIPPRAGSALPNMPVMAQQESNWCWDASAVMTMNYLHQFYPNAPHPPSQCQAMIMRQQVAGGWGPNGTVLDCCATVSWGDTSGCNHSGGSGDILSDWHYAWSFGDTPSLSALTAQISGWQPVIFNVTWNGGGNHAMVVKSVMTDSKGVPWVEIIDPGGGEVEITPYAVWANKDNTQYTFVNDGAYTNIRYTGVGQ
jgi:hypothetical protein